MKHWLLRIAIGLLFVSGYALRPTTVAAAGSGGYDISWPQCGGAVPPSGARVAIVGVTGGRAFTRNPCLAEQFQWSQRATQGHAVYMNVNFPAGSTAYRGDTGPKGVCKPDDWACRAYNYGFNDAEFALHYAQSQHAADATWWIDVETTNSWSDNPAQNVQAIRGAIACLRSHRLAVGIYSTPSMWKEITGQYATNLPVWVVQTDNSVPFRSFCAGSRGFGGGPVGMVQIWGGQFDQDQTCVADPFAHEPTYIPFALTTAQHGDLYGRHGGINTFYALTYPGNLSTRAVTFDFSPSGPNVANALFVTVSQNGTVLATARGTGVSTPGHLSLTFTPTSAAPVIVRIQSFDGSNTPPVAYTITP